MPPPAQPERVSNQRGGTRPSLSALPARTARRSPDDPPRPALPIEPRNRRFDLREERAGHWHEGNPYLTHFWNGLSLMFPEGERFFVDSVRRVREQIRDPRLRDEIRAFLRQEGVHTREHNGFNRVLRQQGYPVAPLEWITRLSLWATRVTSARWQLAITCAFEHFTATLADTVLSDPRTLEAADPAVAELWRWHCVEEVEHKAVAFDVYETLSPGMIGYLRRVLVMMIVTANFLPYTLFHQVALAAADRPVPDLGAAVQTVRFLWAEPGLVRRGLGLYLSYFRPGFHPWEHDNSNLVRSWKTREAEAANGDGRSTRDPTAPADEAL